MLLDHAPAEFSKPWNLTIQSGPRQLFLQLRCP